MRTIYPLLLFFFLAICSCTNPSNDKPVSHSKTGKIIPVVKPVDKIDYFVFGSYFAECGNHCITMYKLDIRKHTLWVDGSKRFWKGADSIKFITEIKQDGFVDSAKKLLYQIPDTLLLSKDSAKAFGCPDCTDGGGIYIEFKQGNKRKKFYLDYQEYLYTPVMKNFTEEVEATMQKLSKAKVLIDGKYL